MRFQELLLKEKSVLVCDVSDEYHDNNDGSNDVDSGKDIDDEMGDDNDSDQIRTLE